MNFRKVLIALAALTLFASLAIADIPVASTLSCTVAPVSAPTVRSEGKAELVGDITITCVNGPAKVGSGLDIGYTNIVLDYGVPVTSPVAGTGIDALLTLDASGGTEPTVAILNGGPICTVTDNKGWNVLAVPTGKAGIGPSCVIGATPNLGTLTGNYSVAFQGFIPTDKPNQVEFDNVPVSALTSNTQHVFRILNVRVTPSGTTPVAATVTFKASSDSLVGLAVGSGSPAAVGTPAAALVGSVLAPGITICGSTTLSGATGNPDLAILTFREGFATAFKPLDLTGAAYPAGASNANAVNLSGNSAKISGVTYNKFMTETGTQVSVAAVATYGIATGPTRVKAVFAGLDKNITYYVTINNVETFNQAATAANTRASLLPQTVPTGKTAETQVVGTFEAAAGTAHGTVNVAKLAVSSTGTATAVWEVTSPDVTAVDSLNFAVYAVFNAATAPTPTTAATVQLGLAPTETTTGAALTWIPRFAAPPAAGAFAPVLKCQTSLLFPFVTNQSGFETGIAVANTSADPFQTTTSAGTCSVQFYGTNAPAAAVVIGPAAGVTAGTVTAATASSLGLVNFQGYGIATCNFQFAHGFAFVQGNAGAANSTAMGYLPVVLAGTTRGQAIQGESLGQ